MGHAEQVEMVKGEQGGLMASPKIDLVRSDFGRVLRPPALEGPPTPRLRIVPPAPPVPAPAPVVAAVQAAPALVIALALLYVLLYSSALVTVKVGVKYCPPLTLLGSRYVVAALTMCGLARWLGLAWPKGARAWLRLGLIGALSTLLPTAMNFVAMRQASASMACITFALNPLLLALVAPRLLGESLTRAKMLGLAVGFGGVLYVMIARLGAGGRSDSTLGVALLVFGTVSMVAGTVLYKRFPPREPLLIVNAVQLMVAGAIALPLAFVFEHPSEAVINGSLIGSFVYLSIFISIGAALLWFWLLSRGEASVASSFLFLTPLFGLGFASLLVGEQLTLRDGVGLIAVIAGIAIIRRASRPAKPAALDAGGCDVLPRPQPGTGRHTSGVVRRDHSGVELTPTARAAAKRSA